MKSLLWDLKVLLLQFFATRLHCKCKSGLFRVEAEKVLHCCLVGGFGACDCFGFFPPSNYVKHIGSRIKVAGCNTFTAV